LTLHRPAEQALQLSGQPAESGVIRLAGHDAVTHHDSSSRLSILVVQAGEAGSPVTICLVGKHPSEAG
jgi:hypothetical protein